MPSTAPITKLYVTKPLRIDGKWHLLELSIEGQEVTAWIDGTLQEETMHTVWVE